MDPNGKVALITGGARIGQVVAAALAKRGCSLALTYRGSRDAADQTAAAARAAVVAAAEAPELRLARTRLRSRLREPIQERPHIPLP